MIWLSTLPVGRHRIGRVFVVVALAAVAGLLLLVPAGGSGASLLEGTLAYSVCGAGSPCVRSWIAGWDLGQARARTLTPRVGAAESRVDDEPAWSADGRKLAFLRVTPTTSGIYVVGADGTGLRRVVALGRASAAADNFMGPQWSPDGKRLVFDRYGAVECSGSKPFRHRLTIARVDGGGTVEVSILAEAAKYVSVFPLLSWSPDGTKLLYSVAHAEYDDEDPGGCRFNGPAPSELYAIEVDGGGRRLLASSDAEFDAAAWSRDGRTVAYSKCYYTDAGGGTVRCDLAVVGADGTGRRTIVGNGGLESGGIAWSAKGDEVIANVGTRLVAIDAKTGRTRRLGPSGVILGVSRSGRYVATHGQSVLLQPLVRGVSAVWLKPAPLPPGAARFRGSLDLTLR